MPTAARCLPSGSGTNRPEAALERHAARQAFTLRAVRHGNHVGRDREVNERAPRLELGQRRPWRRI